MIIGYPNPVSRAWPSIQFTPRGSGGYSKVRISDRSLFIRGVDVDEIKLYSNNLSDVENSTNYQGSNLNTLP